MADPQHPTNGEWELFDPLYNPPPRGVSLLLINEGGVLTVGQWYPQALAWGYKPRIPATVKDRAPSNVRSPHEHSRKARP